MMYAKKIKMQQGCNRSQKLLEIDSIYLDGCDNPGFFKKEVLHDYLIHHPNSIQVAIFPYPDIMPVRSSLGEKYVKSTPDQTQHDNLLSLPREWGV